MWTVGLWAEHKHTHTHIHIHTHRRTCTHKVKDTTQDTKRNLLRCTTEMKMHRAQSHTRMHTQTPTETKTNTHTCFMDLTWCGCCPHWLHHRTDVVNPPPLPLHLSLSLSSVGSVCPSQAPSSSRETRGVLPQSSWPKHTWRNMSHPRWHHFSNSASNSLYWNVNCSVLSVPLSAGQRLHVEVRKQAGNVTGALLL